MKKTMKSAIMIMLVAVMLLCTGCTGELKNLLGQAEEVKETAVVFALGAHANFPQVNYNQFRDEVYAAAYSHGELHAITVDGEPKLTVSYDVIKSSKNISEMKRKQLAEECADVFLSRCCGLAAENPEIDTLSALNMAADILSDSAAEEKVIVVVDSFLSTTGLLNYAENDIFNIDPAFIIEYLRSEYVLPDLTGVRLEVYGMGETAGEQERLSDSVKNKHIELWRAILEETGAVVNIHQKPIGGAEPSKELPHCSIIEIREEPKPLPDRDDIYVYREGLKFKPDRAELVNPAEARRTLAPLIEEMEKDKDLAFSIFGSTATVGTKEGCDRLSLDRARVCKDLLEDMGADPDRLFVFGLGQRICEVREEDVDSRGRLIPDKAALNRAIFIAVRGTDEADSLEKIAA